MLPVTQLGVGIQLDQVKTFAPGPGVSDLPLYSGVKVVGTEKAIKEEMAETWRKVRGPEGEEMRSRMVNVREKCERSWREGGAREGLLGMARYFGDD